MRPKKILFATMALDGHINPLTGLAMHLKEIGHDVRWYTGGSYMKKIETLEIPFYSYRRALEINQFNTELLFPMRKNIKSQVGKLKFDIRNSFILRAPEFYEDIREINEYFNFDILIADIAFTGIPFVKELMQKPVIAVGILPIMQTSVDLPPNGVGMIPSYTAFGKVKQNFLKFFANNILFKNENELMKYILAKYGLSINKGNVFDLIYNVSDLILQSGSPGFEYRRSDFNENIRFIGSLLPYSKDSYETISLIDKIRKYNKVLLVSQGTMEWDTTKLIEPTLKAFAGSDCLVIATTGSSNTKELKEKYPFDNLIIEDFIPYNKIMPYVDVFITNGGYGSVMLGIDHKLPMVAAGIHEGKNEVNARLGYFKLGINLQTERPSVKQIRSSVKKVFENPLYTENVSRLSTELKKYEPAKLCEEYIENLCRDEVELLNIKVEMKKYA